jgi:hypothetical protein
MFFLKPKKAFYQKPWFYIVLTLIVLLGGGRLILPSLILRTLNEKAAVSSPYLSFHAEALELKLWKGELDFKKITGRYGVGGEEFASAEHMHVTLYWKTMLTKRKEIILLFEGMKLKGTKQFAEALEKDGERLRERRRQGHRPIFSIRDLGWKDSEISVPGFPKMFTHFDAHLLNLNPTKKKPYSDFKISSNILESSPLKIDGTIRLRKKPLLWNMDVELKNFNLVALSEKVEKETGILIKEGHVDLAGEIRSENDKTVGYVKPFLKELDVKIPHSGFYYDKADVKGPNFLVKALIKKSERKIIGTKVEFKFEKDLEVEIVKALKTAIEGKTEPGIENKLKFL